MCRWAIGGGEVRRGREVGQVRGILWREIDAEMNGTSTVNPTNEKGRTEDWKWAIQRGRVRESAREREWEGEWIKRKSNHQNGHFPFWQIQIISKMPTNVVNPIPLTNGIKKPSSNSRNINNYRNVTVSIRFVIQSIASIQFYYSSVNQEINNPIQTEDTFIPQREILLCLGGSLGFWFIRVSRWEIGLVCRMRWADWLNWRGHQKFIQTVRVIIQIAVIKRYSLASPSD